MQIKSGLRQMLVSGIVFCGLVIGLTSIDPRVREQVQNLIYGGNGISSWDSRATELGHAIAAAVRHQSIENSPMTIFVVASIVLFVFMARA